MKLSRFFIGFFAGLYVFLMSQAIQSAPIEYNTLISLKSLKFDKRAIWTHAWSRDLENNTGEVGNNSSGRSKSRAQKKVDFPESHHELLLGTSSTADKRDRDGNQFFIIQSANYPDMCGPVHYNDKVKILSVFSGPGIPDEEGLQQEPRVWWVHYPARLFPDYCEIGVSFPSTKYLNDNEQYSCFSFIDSAAADNAGPVESGDTIKIKSLSGHEKSDGCFLWAFEESRWGKGFQDILIKKGDDREKENGGFVIETIVKDSLIAEGKTSYDNLFANSAYDFLLSVQEMPVGLKKSWGNFADAYRKLNKAKDDFAMKKETIKPIEKEVQITTIPVETEKKGVTAKKVKKAPKKRMARKKAGTKTGVKKTGKKVKKKIKKPVVKKSEKAEEVSKEMSGFKPEQKPEETEEVAKK
ncbi:MAG: hypothetical protein V1855_01715 [bacterium]